MPYATIQDINTSQSIFARLFNVGSISVYSAYDNNQMALENISNPSKAEEIIFSKMTESMNRFAYRQPNYLNRNMPPRNYPEEYYDDDDVSITPIDHERVYGRRQYEYYPEELNYDTVQRPRYEYEPYGESLENEISRAMNASNYSQGDSYYNEVRRDYSYSSDDEYYDTEEQFIYDAPHVQESSPAQEEVAESSEKIIRRHFDKFKR